MKKKGNVYESLPWKNLDEYYELVKKHGLAGTELKVYLEAEIKKERLLLPKLKLKLNK